MRNKFYWNTESLIVVGLFTALNKVVSLLIALIGGGMNPVTMMLKNGVATALLIVMVSRVRKFGVLALYTLIAQVVSFLIAGGGLITLLPAFLLAGLISDSIIHWCGGYRKLSAVVFGVAMYDLLGRVISLSWSFLTVRENEGMFIFGAVVVGLGYLGCLLIGIPCGIKFTKELRHAGIIREL
ncbi:MAG: MptD family putative ECF transporter S component [Pontiella sp.]